MSKFAVILPAAGQSSRFNDPLRKKTFALLEGKAVWLHAAEKFAARDDVKQILVVVSAADRDDFQEKFAGNAMMLGVEIVVGGATRTASVAQALARVKPDIDFVAVHDAARPCLVDAWIASVFAAAEQTGAAILATPVAATLKRVGADRRIAETVSRDQLWEAQTPQVFRRQLLLDAYARHSHEPATDDAQLVERLGQPVAVVPGSALNLKITTQEDLRLAAQVLKILPKPKLNAPAHPFADDDLWR